MKNSALVARVHFIVHTILVSFCLFCNKLQVHGVPFEVGTTLRNNYDFIFVLIYDVTVHTRRAVIQFFTCIKIRFHIHLLKKEV